MERLCSNNLAIGVKANMTMFDISVNPESTEKFVSKHVELNSPQFLSLELSRIVTACMKKIELIAPRGGG